MFPTPAFHSVPASSRPSMLGGGTNVPSEANLSRLRSRLRQSGAIMSSRSVASRADVQTSFEVVDVGEGIQPTGVEHLLARLEQHGLRRRLAAEDDASAYDVDVVVRGAEAQNLTHSITEDAEEKAPLAAPTSTGDSEAADLSSRGPTLPSVSTDRTDDREAREPYYYLCVPCELRLTCISRRAPMWRALEDVHFHFSSAAHRSTASWMADDDIDETLRSTPFVIPSTHYSRIFVNGVPTLLSRRPGGGDMFYPLPHELDAVRPPARGHETGRDSFRSSRATSVDASRPFQLFPSSSARGELGGPAVLWYRALPSVYTGAVQLLRRVGALPSDKRHRKEKVYRVSRSRARAQVYVSHVDVGTYLEHTQLPPHQLPIMPVVLPIHRARVAKALLKGYLPPSPTGTAASRSVRGDTAGSDAPTHADDPHRTVYSQSYVPMAEGMGNEQEQGGGSRSVEPPAPLTVFEDQSYRVALVSSEDQKKRLEHQPLSASRELLRNEEEAPVVLTREVLTQHTQTTSQAWQSPARSGVSASMATSRQGSATRSSLPPSQSQSERSPSVLGEER